MYARAPFITLLPPPGIPLKSTLDNVTSVHYASQIHSLTAKARSVIKEIDSSNDLKFMRVRSKKHEILVAPGMLFTTLVFRLLWAA